MKNFVAALLLGAALLRPTANAEERPEIFSAYTTGYLSIDAEGRVEDLSVDRKLLDPDVMRDAEAQMRRWRFEPILENGRPVAATAAMNLELMVVWHPGSTGFRVSFESVQFLDVARKRSDRRHLEKMTPPNFPFAAYKRGIGSVVRLVLRLDDKERVARVAVKSVSLLGDLPDGEAAELANKFVRSSEKAAARWRFPKHKGMSITVPVRFDPQMASTRRLVMAHPIPIEVPAWVAEEVSAVSVEALGYGGPASLTYWKLTTPLDE